MMLVFISWTVDTVVFSGEHSILIYSEYLNIIQTVPCLYFSWKNILSHFYIKHNIITSHNIENSWLKSWSHFWKRKAKGKLNLIVVYQDGTSWGNPQSLTCSSNCVCLDSRDIRDWNAVNHVFGSKNIVFGHFWGLRTDNWGLRTEDSLFMDGLIFTPWDHKNPQKSS